MRLGWRESATVAGPLTAASLTCRALAAVNAQRPLWRPARAELFHPSLVLAMNWKSWARTFLRDEAMTWSGLHIELTSRFRQRLCSLLISTPNYTT